MLAVLVCMIPVYWVMSHWLSSSMVWESYHYDVSVSFLHGWVPVCVVSLVLCVVMGCTLYGLRERLKGVLGLLGKSNKQWYVRGGVGGGGKNNNSQEDGARGWWYEAVGGVMGERCGRWFGNYCSTRHRISLVPVPSSQSDMRSRCMFVLRKYVWVVVCQVVNVCVTVAVNVSYVYVVISYDEALSRWELLCLQGVLGGFKLLWNARYVSWSSDRLSEYWSHESVFQQRYVMSMVNYLMAPVAAIVLTHPSCMYHVLVPPPAVTSSAVIDVCDVYMFSYSLRNIKHCPGQLSYEMASQYYPSFQYNYTCGTSLLVTYVPVLMYAYVLSGVCLPLGRLLLSHKPELLRWCSCMYDVFFVESHRSSGHRRMKVESVDDRDGDVDKDLDEGVEMGIRISRDGSSTDTCVDVSVVNELDRENEVGMIRIYGRGAVSALLLHSTMLLTFGLACPVLGCMMGWTLVSDVLLMRLLIGRYVCKTLGWFGKKVSVRKEECRESVRKEEGYEYRDMSVHEMSKLERDNQDSWVGLYGCRGLLVGVVSVYWCVLYVDMIGDVEGVWVVLSVILGFLCMLLVLFLFFVV